MGVVTSTVSQWLNESLKRSGFSLLKMGCFDVNPGGDEPTSWEGDVGQPIFVLVCQLLPPKDAGSWQVDWSPKKMLQVILVMTGPFIR